MQILCNFEDSRQDFFLKRETFLLCLAQVFPTQFNTEVGQLTCFYTPLLALNFRVVANPPDNWTDLFGRQTGVLNNFFTRLDENSEGLPDGSRPNNIPKGNLTSRHWAHAGHVQAARGPA